MMNFSEHDNRKKAKNLAEFITGDALRRYMADKVRQYAGEQVSVFDGAAGSGQLCQYIQPTEFVAVEIQPEACRELAKNFPHAKICNQSFFDFSSDFQADCAVMNPPFSIKFKDLSDAEQANIQALFPWKKSGVVDDVFVLKAMQYSKRWGFFILSCGVGCRSTEKHFRQLIGNQAVEINKIDNAFDDTSIPVMVLIIDKQKTSSEYHSEFWDVKTDEKYTASLTLNDDRWEFASKPIEEKFGKDFDIDKLNQDLLNETLKGIELSIKSQKQMQFLTGIDFNKFCNDIIEIVSRYKDDNLLQSNHR